MPDEPNEIPGVIRLPIPKTNEELKIFMILEDQELKAAYKDYLLQEMLNAAMAEKQARNVKPKEAPPLFKPETLA